MAACLGAASFGLPLIIEKIPNWQKLAKNVAHNATMMRYTA
jgi:hypothetical protein